MDTSLMASQGTFNFVNSDDLVRRMLNTICSIVLTLPSLCVDLEGVATSQLMTPSVLVLHLPFFPFTYIVDLHTLGDRAFSIMSTTRLSSKRLTLKNILEHKDTPKIAFDVRHLSRVLFAKYQINLQNVYDLQVMDFSRQGHTWGVSHRLSRCIESDACLGQEEFFHWRHINQKAERKLSPLHYGTPDVFLERPVPNDILQYCVVNIIYFPKLWDVYKASLSETSMRGVMQETTKRIQQAQQQSRTLPGPPDASSLATTFDFQLPDPRLVGSFSSKPSPNRSQHESALTKAASPFPFRPTAHESVHTASHLSTNPRSFGGPLASHPVNNEVDLLARQRSGIIQHHSTSSTETTAKANRLPPVGSSTFTIATSDHGDDSTSSSASSSTAKPRRQGRSPSMRSENTIKPPSPDSAVTAIRSPARSRTLPTALPSYLRHPRYRQVEQANPQPQKEIRSASVLGLPTLLKNLNINHHRNKDLPPRGPVSPASPTNPWETINSSTTSTQRPGSTIFPSADAFPTPQPHHRPPPSPSASQSTLSTYRGPSHANFSQLSLLSSDTGFDFGLGAGGGGMGMPTGLGGYRWKEEFDPEEVYLGDLINEGERERKGLDFEIGRAFYRTVERSE